MAERGGNLVIFFSPAKLSFERRGRVNHLRRMAVREAKGRTKDFMAVDQICQALLEDRNIKQSDDTVTAHVRAFRAMA